MFAIGRVFLFYPYLLSSRAHKYITLEVLAALVDVKPAMVELSRWAESDERTDIYFALHFYYCSWFYEGRWNLVE